MQNCLFCKIVNSEIPNYTVYENEKVLAFLDVHPCSKGHTVVVPKKHAQMLNELTPEEWDSLMSGLREAILIVGEKLKPAGMNVGVNDGPSAGQAVPHIHWHIIPRYEKDGGGSMHSIIRSDDTGEVSETAKLFK